MSTPKKPEEILLWNSFGVWGEQYESPHEAIENLDIPVKMALRFLEKWERKGIYDYGVAIDRGWKTPPPGEPQNMVQNPHLGRWTLPNVELR